ncbi:ER lumen protein retaining receptor [Penicillium digitatum]|uniref:Uncharacterized protein n=3 Tax=Penicillium digitatum TaxID=36651 RepID=K9GE22_PEND2|nr:hypothetical protein PDIP_26270 [Penicillium digitatum Pd1]EKV13048.1 hypothetical protein PDIG_40720 [Penicillium digitatum PHI26]EKV18741.1 hypothetical protein PDIP_26270 [Penicillium digitatum Pd1]QQK42758.1 ER lumen protein retaining receptor [Penicillium digitatum]
MRSPLTYNNGQIMGTEYRLAIIRLVQFQREHTWSPRQAGPGLVATFPLNRKATVQVRYRCHHQDLIRYRGRRLISTVVLHMSLYYQHRLDLAADLAHVKLGRDLRRCAVELLHLRKPHQQVLALLFHPRHQVAVTDIRFPGNPALHL